MYLCGVIQSNNTTMENAVIYARVSTLSQDYDRQVEELRTYAQRNDYQIVAEFTEKISGAKKVDERNAMSEMLEFVAANNVKRVLVYECSRISRRAADFLNVIDYLTEHKISLYIHQNGLETLQRDGSVNPIAQLVLGIIGQFNQMERGLIRSRMESGYNHYRSNGGKVGRKAGYKKSTDQMKEEYAEEIRLLKKGISLRNVQKISGTSINTLRKLKEMVVN